MASTFCWRVTFQNRVRHWLLQRATHADEVRNEAERQLWLQHHLQVRVQVFNKGYSAEPRFSKRYLYSRESQHMHHKWLWQAECLQEGQMRRPRCDVTRDMHLEAHLLKGVLLEALKAKYIEDAHGRAHLHAYVNTQIGSSE